MRSDSAELATSWSMARVGDHYAVRKKPRELRPTDSDMVAFIPMEGIPAGGQEAPRFELRQYGALTSGVFFQEGDILLSRITPSFENGKQAIASGLPSGFGFGSTEIIPLHPTSGEADPLYLFYSLLHPTIREHLVHRMEGATGRQRVPDSAVLDLSIPYPPPVVQRQHSGALRDVQQAIGIQTRVIATARELKQATMSHLFTCGLRGEKQKETEIGLVPESWEVGVLGDLCDKPEYGFTASAVAEPIGPHMLRITDIQERGVNWTSVPYCSCPKNELDRKRLTDGDVVVARIGATTGKSFWVMNPPEAVFASYLIRLRVQPGLDSCYLYQWMQSSGYWEQINAQKDANLKGGVNSVTLTSLKLPLPSPAEQTAIASRLGTIDQAMSVGVLKSESLDELFRSLLDGLMSGVLRLSDVEGVAAELTAK